jgi:hypothetical protein
MFLFRGTEWSRGLAPEEIQQVMTQWKNWFEGLSNQGIVKAGHPLERTGKVVSGRKGRNVADGPFAESKEAVGGYFFLEVGTLDEAVAIAQNCPALDYGAVVEVRPVADVCPTMRQCQEHQELAHAAA